MPSKTEKQRKFMGAELGRKRAGKKTKTGMSEEKLKHFARKAEEGAVVALAEGGACSRTHNLIKAGFEEGK